MVVCIPGMTSYLSNVSFFTKSNICWCYYRHSDNHWLKRKGYPWLWWGNHRYSWNASAYWENDALWYTSLNPEWSRHRKGIDGPSHSLVIVCCTSANLAKLAKEGLFRRGFSFCLKIMNLKLLSLRKHQGDAILLTNHFLQVCTKQFGYDGKKLHPDMLKRCGRIDQWQSALIRKVFN